MSTTIIAPSTAADAVRSAGSAYLGNGRDLVAGGVAWDMPLDSSQREALEAAGAEIYDRQVGDLLPDVVERAGHTLAETDLQL